ncbi:MULTISPECIES: hypothetical protein [Burkholderia]|uniref:hypothetical protein n=1 Tax=Burkholderia TaxID=32008 RepID=UPI00064ECEE8|nr:MULTISPECIES: hypothetical protein [Burkholderia]KML15412.1 hypothetical protein VL00_14580 [Burkholderia cepacia]KML42351.1 hypothetical protein VL13_11860 [Burkholderia lata]KMN62397.1 hypothetical protein VK92_03650 [Burkholderia sp. LK4]
MKNITNENLRIISTISRRSMWAWIKTLLIGSAFVFTNIIVGLCLTVNSQQHGIAAAHVSGHAYPLAMLLAISDLFRTNFFPSLLVLSGFLNVPLFIVLANKQAISTLIYNAHTLKLTDFLELKIQALINRVISRQPEFTKHIPNWRALRSKLIHENKSDSMSWLFKKATNYCLRKIKMDDVNFSDPKLSYPEFISTKLKQFTQESLKPSMTFVWMACIANVLLIILAITLRSQTGISIYDAIRMQPGD